jgi:hypothetical protein
MPTSLHISIEKSSEDYAFPQAISSKFPPLFFLENLSKNRLKKNCSMRQKISNFTNPLKIKLLIIFAKNLFAHE